MGLAKYYVCHWPKDNVSPKYYDEHIGDYAVVKDTLYKGLDSAVEAGLANLGRHIKNVQKFGVPVVVGVNNLITLVPKIVDQDGQIWPDITEIQIKNMNKLEFPISINNGNSSEYKTSVTNGASVTFKLENRGRATLRFKAMVPELSHIWISLYPELYGYDEDGLAKLASWAASQQ
jgi:hypothetical protein